MGPLPACAQAWSGRLRSGTETALLQGDGGYRERFSVAALEDGLTFESDVEFPLYLTGMYRLVDSANALAVVIFSWNVQFF